MTATVVQILSAVVLAYMINYSRAQYFTVCYNVTLRADTGLYLSRNHDPSTNSNPIKVNKEAPDATTNFTLVAVEGKIALRADNGKYLTTVTRGSSVDQIEAEKTCADKYTRFELIEIDSPFDIALKAHNGKHLSRADRGPDQHFVEASQDTSDLEISNFKFDVIPNSADGCSVQISGC